MKSPKISVCIPVHNAELWLAESIESIIDQSFQDWEIVTFDDGSTDGSFDIYKHYKKILGEKYTPIQLRNAGQPYGIAVSRNYCIQKSLGQIIVVQDADDISHKDRLKKTWKYFQRHKKVDIVYGSYQYVNEFGQPMAEEPAKPFDEKKLLKENYIGHPTVAFRRNIGVNYRPECKVIDDWFFYLDCIKAGKKFGVINEVLTFYRVLHTSVSRSDERQEEVKKMKEKFLEEANSCLVGK